MNFGDFLQAIQDGGWIILIAYFIYKELWPLITNKIIPAQVKAAEDERKARLSEIDADRQFHREMEIQRAKTLETISGAIQVLSVNMAQTNERAATILSALAGIQRQQEATLSVLNAAIADMKEAAARRRKLDTGPLKNEP